MRSLLFAAALCACGGDDTAADPDAGIDATDLPPSGAYWPCHAWDDVSVTLSKCSPNCANHTLLGRLVWGESNTCEIRPGEFCPTENMTGPAYEGGTGCCVYATSPIERVEFLGCL